MLAGFPVFFHKFPALPITQSVNLVTLTIRSPYCLPETEHTVTQLLHKSRIVSVYKKINDFKTSSKQRNYEDNTSRRVPYRAYSRKPSNFEL